MGTNRSNYGGMGKDLAAIWRGGIFSHRWFIAYYGGYRQRFGDIALGIYEEMAD